MNITSQHTAALHTRYLELTGREEPRYTMHHHFCWEVWCGAGYTMADLELVIAYIKRKIRLKERKPESFKFALLIQDGPRFADDLGDAKAALRQFKPPPGKASVLKASGRASSEPQRPAKTAADILRESEVVQKCLKQIHEDLR